MRILALATLLVLVPTLTVAQPTWSTRFAPVGFDESPRRSTIHQSAIVLQGGFTRLDAAALTGLGSYDGTEATDLGASLEALLATQGNVVNRLGDVISWNGELVTYCQYGPAPNYITGKSLFAHDGSGWRQLPDPPYSFDQVPEFSTLGSTLVVNCSFYNAPNGERIGLLDDQENWTLLSAPVPDVTPEPWWDGGSPYQARSLAIVGGEIHAYTLTAWSDTFAPVVYTYTFWRVDRYDGSAWHPLTAGREDTSVASQGGYTSGTTWGMRLEAVGTQLFRHTTSGDMDAPDHALEEYVSPTGFSTTNRMPSGATSIARFAPATGGVIAAGAGTNGNWVGFFDGSSWTMYGEQIDGPVTTLAQLGSETWIFGDFTSVAGQDMTGGAVYQGGSWAPAFGVSMAPFSTVLSIAGHDGLAHAGTDGGVFPGTPGSVAAWDGEDWMPRGDPGTAAVDALYPWNGALLAGGNGQLCAGGSCDHLVTALQSGLWSTMGDLQTKTFCIDDDCSAWPTMVEDFQEHGGQLYACGDFVESATGSLPSGVAVWSAADGDWLHPGPGLSALNRSASFFYEPWVHCLASTQGYLLIGGDFSSATTPDVSLVGYDGTQTIPLGSSLFAAYTTNELPSVVDILAMPEGLYVCGTLRPDAPGDPLATVAFQPADEFPDGAWLALGAGVNGTVSTMIPYEDGVLVGGKFSSAGGLACNSIAFWDGTQWSAPIEGITAADGSPGSIEAMALIGNDLHIGGSFAFAGDVPSANYAILERVTTVAAEPAPSRARTALLGVSPNPFNPATRIRFDLADPAGSHLDLYDTAGRRVRRFDLSDRAVGEGSVEWNGTDSGGRRVASGVYFVRLQSGGTVDQLRVVLLK